MFMGEKPKDFKGIVQRLIAYIGRYKIALSLVLVMAVGSTVFNIVGPRILSKATTELFNGLVAKVAGTGGIDFGKIGSTLSLLLCLYVISAAFNAIQGWTMAGITQDLCFRLRKEISEKINRMPMKYFEGHCR